MRIFLLILIATLCCAPTSWGQKPFLEKAVQRLLRKEPQRLVKEVLPSTLLKTQVEQSISASILEQAAKRHTDYDNIFPPLEDYFRKSIFALRTTSLRGHSWLSTGFVFEEEYQDQKILWGIISEHAITGMAHKPDLIFLVDGEEWSFKIDIVVRGNKEFADMALIRLPESLRPHVIPLQIAGFEPSVEQNGVSFSYYNTGQFGASSLRKVLKVTPSRIISTYAFYNSPRIGSCGAPFLINGVVVGVHCGSSARKEVSYAVNARVIPSLLQAAHNNGVSLRHLYLNGNSVAALNIDEGVSRITAFNKQKRLYTKNAPVIGSFVDYDHLEKTIPLQGVTDLYIDIATDNLFSTHPKFPDLFRKIKTLHYNVLTQQAYLLTPTGKLLFSYFNRLSPHHNK